MTDLAHSKLPSDSRRHGRSTNGSESGGGRHNLNGNGSRHSSENVGERHVSDGNGKLTRNNIPENGGGRHTSNGNSTRHQNSENGGSRHNSSGSGSGQNSETEKQRSTPNASGSKTANHTTARPGSSLNTRQTNSTPRLRSRPAPLLSISSPLARTLSMRVSKKEKRLSLRLADPTSPLSTTYRDDYQSPETLTLSSLSLETTADTNGDFDANLPTTYRQSFRWRAEKNLSKTSSSKDSKMAPGSQSHTGEDTADRNRQTPATMSEVRIQNESVTSSASPVSSNCSADVRNGRVSSDCGAESTATRPSTAVPLIQLPVSETPPRRPLSFYRRNDSSGVKFSAQSVASSDIKSPSPTENSMPFKPASGKEKATVEHVRGNRPLVREVVSEVGSQSRGTPPGPKLANGVTARALTSSNSGNHTPQRSPAYQLQSSNGGSPFVYGSGSGYWV